MERLEEVMVSLRLCYHEYDCSLSTFQATEAGERVRSQESKWLVGGTRAVSSRLVAAMND